MRKRILAIIPAHNEEESLPTTLNELAEVRPDIDLVVVDDGSTDKTAEIVRAMGYPVISLPVNLCVGGAVQTGLHYAHRHGYDVAFQYDADGQHQPDQIVEITEPIIRGEFDVVLGSRFKKRRSYRVSLLRGSIMWLFGYLSSKAIGQRITDTTSGFRAWGRDAIRFMTVNCSCDFPDVESTVMLTRNGFRFVEVPVLMRDRVAGRSMFTPLRATYFVIRSLMAVLISVLITPRRLTRRIILEEENH